MCDVISCENPRDALGVTARCRNVRFPPRFFALAMHCTLAVETYQENSAAGLRGDPHQPHRRLGPVLHIPHELAGQSPEKLPGR